MPKYNIVQSNSTCHITCSNRTCFITYSLAISYLYIASHATLLVQIVTCNYWQVFNNTFIITHILCSVSTRFTWFSQYKIGRISCKLVSLHELIAISLYTIQTAKGMNATANERNYLKQNLLHIFED